MRFCLLVVAMFFGISGVAAAQGGGDGEAPLGYRLADRWRTGKIDSIAMAPDGSILTASGGGAGRVTRFDPSGRRLASFAIDARAPTGLDTDAAGNIYVIDSGRIGRGKRAAGGGKRIAVFNASGKLLRRLGLPENVSRVDGYVSDSGLHMDIAVAPDGTSYIADANIDSVIVVAPDGSYAGRIVLPQEGVPEGIAVSKDGSSLYVAHAWGSRVLQFDLASRSLVRTLNTFNTSPIGEVAVTPDGRVIVGDYGFPYIYQQLHEFSAEGAYLGISAGGVNLAVGIVADGAGAIYVAGRTLKGWSIAKLDPGPGASQRGSLGPAPRIDRVSARDDRILVTRVRCGDGAVGCIGRFEVRIRGRVIGRSRYAIPAGRYTDVWLGLPRPVRRALRSGSRVRAYVRVKDRERGNRGRAVRLKKTPPRGSDR